MMPLPLSLKQCEGTTQELYPGDVIGFTFQPKVFNSLDGGLSSNARRFVGRAHKISRYTNVNNKKRRDE